MSSIIWVLIPLVAIIGAYFIDYQKNKLKWQAKNSENDKELVEVKEMMHQMKKRIENLEAIVVDDMHNGTDTFSMWDEEEILKRKNERTVAKKAKSKGE